MATNNKPVTQAYWYEPFVVDLKTYQRIKSEVAEYQPDALKTFNAIDKWLEQRKKYRWAFLGCFLYLAYAFIKSLIVRGYLW